MSTNLASLLWQTASSGPERAALYTRDSAISFGELRERAAGVARALLARNQAGDRIAIFLPRSAEAVAAIFGVHAAGMIAVVLNERLRARQLAYQMEHCGAGVLVTRPELTEAASLSLPAGISAVDVSAIAPGADLSPDRVAPETAAQIIYTSGSTGLPKGVVFGHGALLAGVGVVNNYLGQRADDRVAGLLSFSTVYGLNQMLTAVACGAALVVETSPLIEEIVSTLKSRETTVLAAVPALWVELLGSPRFTSVGLPSLRLLQNAGGRLQVESVRRIRDLFPESQLFLQYGQTETFRGAFLPPSEVDRRPDAMGIPVPGSAITIVREDGSAATANEVGELVYAGPTVASGYWNDPDATSRVFRAHPDPTRAARGERVVFSGDLVKRDDEGMLVWVSRRDSLIKTMGFRVGPDEVVEVLLASGEVAEAVVAGEPDAARGEKVVAFVVLRPGADMRRLVRYARSELPAFMVPSRYEEMISLPRLPSGKYDVATLVAGNGDAQKGERK